MQALERTRRSSLKQLDITLAMATGLVAYFICGARRQGKCAKTKARYFQQLVSEIELIDSLNYKSFEERRGLPKKAQ